MSNSQKVMTPQVVLQLLVFLVLVPLLPILIAWRWKWWEAWTFAGVNILGFAISRALAARRHPDILAERARSMQLADAKPWDKVLSRLVGLGGALIPLVAGLDARYDWTKPDFNLLPEVIALALIVAGFAFGSWALVENRFFSGVVRIQRDRGQTVVEGGPYRFLRHPGYAGALLTYFATPVLLDSLWTYLPAVFLAFILLVRTDLEDRTLHRELPGYKEYAKKTRYRLLPGVW
ncbi:MAG: methyltransferase family protein [Chloroflexota bacterium]